MVPYLFLTKSDSKAFYAIASIVGCITGFVLDLVRIREDIFLLLRRLNILPLVS